MGYKFHLLAEVSSEFLGKGLLMLPQIQVHPQIFAGKNSRFSSERVYPSFVTI